MYIQHVSSVFRYLFNTGRVITQRPGGIMIDRNYKFLPTYAFSKLRLLMQLSLFKAIVRVQTRFAIHNSKRAWNPSYQFIHS